MLDKTLYTQTFIYFVTFDKLVVDGIVNGCFCILKFRLWTLDVTSYLRMTCMLQCEVSMALSKTFL